MTILGTRPEVIKLAPVIQQLEARNDVLETVNVSSSQHTDLLYPFLKLFGVRIDHDLQVMRAGQGLNGLCARVLERLDPLLDQVKPDFILVQGDTTTAMGGALAAFHKRVPVGHVEAGLRTGNAFSPFPEEVNRRLVTRLAAHHYAPTAGNVENLLSEGVPRERIFLTGNPVVDSLMGILRKFPVPSTVKELLRATEGLKRVVLTTHRRESFGGVMAENLRMIRDFVEHHSDVAVIFPVHPNPAVVSAARSILSSHPRIQLIEPLRYDEFVFLLANAWLIVSDSGGVQEEAPTLGKPLLILRENTEVPEAVECGVARLVGGNPVRFRSILEEVYEDNRWMTEVREIDNPFGQGDSGKQIADAIELALNVSSEKSCLESGWPFQSDWATNGAPRSEFSS